MILDVTNCDSLFTPDGLALIREILGWIKIIAPSLVLLLVSLDFASAVVSQDGKSFASNANVQKTYKRIIAVALLFFVPTIVSAILNVDGIKGIVSNDPLCAKATGTKAEGLLFFKDEYNTEGSSKNIKLISQIGNSVENKDQNDDSSGGISIGPGNDSKRSYRTVTINGRTYDDFVQKYLGDIPFDGCNLKDCGCSAMAFASAASGFDRSITAYEAASMVKARSFDGIKRALDQKGIGYSGPYYYNSNDNNEARVQQLSQTIREHLAQGKPVICLVAGGPYANQNHFITLFGEDDNGNVIIGNCRRETGTIEEIVRESMCGGRKGALLIG